MNSPDPGFWKDIATWLWGVLLLPVGILWKKADGAVQKDDFKEFCERFEKHCEKDTQIQAKLFDQIRENDQRAQDRFERLMNKITNGH